MGSDASRAPRRPDVSIVVPTHDTPRALLHRALVTALTQEGPARFEIVVCDDGSAPGPARDVVDLVGALRAGTDIPIHLVRHPEQRGPSAARNTAVREAARGEYVFWLDSDDRIDSRALSAMLGTARRTSAELVISRCVVHEPGKVPVVRDPERYLRLGRRHARTVSDPLAQVVFSVQAQLVRRETFLGVGGFAEELRFAEITQLFLKLAAKVGIDQVVLDQHIAYHYHRRQNSHSQLNRSLFEQHRKDVLTQYARQHVVLGADVLDYELEYFGPSRDGAQHYRFLRADGSLYEPEYHREFRYEQTG